MDSTRRRLSGLLAGLLCLALLVGCDDQADPEPVPTDVRVEQQRLLDVRDRAVRAGNRRLFMSTVARGDRAFVRRQRAWFDNVSQLPWEVFDTRVGESSWPEQLLDAAWGEEATLPRVRQRSQLRGYDSAPVTRVTGLAFAHRQGRLKVVGDRAGGTDPFPGWSPAPWDLTPIVVREQSGVLGLFDAETRDDADAVMRTVTDGVEEVSRGLPFRWSRRVVVYAFGDRDVLASFDDVPGGKIQHLGAMTFPVRSGAGSDKVVGLRFTVLPSSIEAGQPFLGRIVRHELTHVAVGHRDDGAPLWFSEGLAEYVGARGVPRAERRIAAVAVRRARAGATAMPTSATFNGPQQDWHYALSWMACDYIAATYGEARLWELMRELSRDGRGTRDEEQDDVLTRVLGFGASSLADRASDRIVSIYR